MTVDFCLPVYNEEQILENSVLTLLRYLQEREWDFDWRIMIVVNGSQDGSLDIAKELSGQHRGEVEYVNFDNKGRGQALKNIFYQSQADVAMYMDIDLAVSLDNIYDLLEPIIKKEKDLVIGSRLLPGSRIDRSFLRELSSQTYNLLSRIILNHRFSDLQCGFKAVRTDRFQNLASLIKSNAWFFDTELIAWSKEMGFSVQEVPISWSENRYDKRKSKVNLFKDSLVFIKNLFDLRKRIKRKG